MLLSPKNISNKSKQRLNLLVINKNDDVLVLTLPDTDLHFPGLFRIFALLVTGGSACPVIFLFYKYFGSGCRDRGGCR